jgi:hypothetical protein
MAQPGTLIFRVSLRARLYRDIEVSSSSTLADLAEAIVAAFSFDMDHAYGFYLCNDNFGVLAATIMMAGRQVLVWAGASAGERWT